MIERMLDLVNWFLLFSFMLRCEQSFCLQALVYELPVAFCIIEALSLLTSEQRTEEILPKSFLLQFLNIPQDTMNPTSGTFRSFVNLLLG